MPCSRLPLAELRRRHERSMWAGRFSLSDDLSSHNARAGRRRKCDAIVDALSGSASSTSSYRPPRSAFGTRSGSRAATGNQSPTGFWSAPGRVLCDKSRIWIPSKRLSSLAIGHHRSRRAGIASRPGRSALSVVPPPVSGRGSHGLVSAQPRRSLRHRDLLCTVRGARAKLQLSFSKRRQIDGCQILRGQVDLRFLPRHNVGRRCLRCRRLRGILSLDRDSVISTLPRAGFLPPPRKLDALPG